MRIAVQRSYVFTRSICGSTGTSLDCTAKEICSVSTTTAIEIWRLEYQAWGFLIDLCSHSSSSLLSVLIAYGSIDFVTYVTHVDLTSLLVIVKHTNTCGFLSANDFLFIYFLNFVCHVWSAIRYSGRRGSFVHGVRDVKCTSHCKTYDRFVVCCSSSAFRRTSLRHQESTVAFGGTCWTTNQHQSAWLHVDNSCQWRRFSSWSATVAGCIRETTWGHQ